MPDSLWAAFALVLVVEGFLPFVAPRFWRESFAKLVDAAPTGSSASSASRRSLLGLAGFWLARHA